MSQSQAVAPTGRAEAGFAQRAAEATIRAFAGALCRGADGARLNILIYHRVCAAEDPLGLDGIPVARFEQQIAWLRRCFSLMPLSEAIARLRDGRLPPRAACVTFDDGYADNALHALPVLTRHRAAATFFIAAGFLDGGRMFNDTVIESVRACRADSVDLSALGLGRYRLSGADARRNAIESIIAQIKYRDYERRDELAASVADACGASPPNDLMMTAAQVRTLVEAGMEVGGHTWSHPILTRIGERCARDEILRGRDRLAALTGRPVRLFAYPNGEPGRDYHRLHVDMVRSLGFDGAVTTAWGSAGRGSDPFQLPRFTPWDRSPRRFATRLALNYLRRHAARV